MRFIAKGQFETENLIDVVQRLTAQLQDADVRRVADINVYLTVCNGNGLKRELLLDGEAIDRLELDCADLVCAAPKRTLAISRHASGSAAPRSQHTRSRRPTKSEGRS